MSIEQRRFIRFSLDIPVIRHGQKGEAVSTVVQQISLGGCMLPPNEDVFTGDEFRLEFYLPNGNRLPLISKAIYKFEGKGVGVKFTDISQFEQELLAVVISQNLDAEGLPLLVDPFVQHPMKVNANQELYSKALLARVEEELRIDSAISKQQLS